MITLSAPARVASIRITRQVSGRPSRDRVEHHPLTLGEWPLQIKANQRVVQPLRIHESEWPRYGIVAWGAVFEPHQLSREGWP